MRAKTIALAFVAVMAALPANAAGVYQYIYTGNPFGVVSDDPSIDGTFTTSMHVFANFTLNNPIPANLGTSSSLANITASVTYFSFDSGRNNFNNNSTASFNVQTDASGNIIAWDINMTVVAGQTSYHIDTLNFSTPYQPLRVDSAYIELCISGSCTSDSAFLFDRPGSWYQFFLPTPTVVTPLPAALPLFASGLAALGWLARFRRKQAV